MATYTEIGEFISNNEKLVKEIHTIICSSYDGESRGCIGCVKEMAIIDSIINWKSNV